MKPSLSNTGSNDTLSQLKSSISFPLLSKVGKAQKLPLPRYPPVSMPSPIPDESLAFKIAEQELKKLSEIKLHILKNPKKLPPSSCFRTVSRSSNASPMSNSPPPTRYNPNFEFLNRKVKGAIAYRQKSQNTGSRKIKSPKPSNNFLQVTESLKFIKPIRTFTPSPQRF